MSKEDDLRALREHVAVDNVNTVKTVYTDVDAIKYLDGLRRKATTIEEVDIIDLIVKRTFHEGMNRITGRIHGERVADTPEPKSEVKAKADRREYHREYMRKRRAK